MALKVRKQVYIDSDQEFTLKQLANGRVMSEAKIIRQAINRYALTFQSPRHAPSAWRREKAFIQQMIAQNPAQDSTPKKRAWKREDLFARHSASVGT